MGALKKWFSGYNGTRYWDGTKWANIPVMAELKPAYNNTSKPGATEDIPESNFLCRYLGR